jgi:hypothetical protein
MMKFLSLNRLFEAARGHIGIKVSCACEDFDPVCRVCGKRLQGELWPPSRYKTREGLRICDERALHMSAESHGLVRNFRADGVIYLCRPTAALLLPCLVCSSAFERERNPGDPK